MGTKAAWLVEKAARKAAGKLGRMPFPCDNKQEKNAGQAQKIETIATSVYLFYINLHTVVASKLSSNLLI